MNAAFTLKSLQSALRQAQDTNTGLRSQLQMQVLEIEELRRVLLALVQEIEKRYAWTGQDVELQLQDAREALAKVGLL